MRAPYPLNRLDDVLGDAIERTVRSHHGRRLAKRGHAAAFDPPAGGWAASGSFAPREGCSAEVLVDGVSVLPRMVEDIAAAQSHVHVSGWYFTPSFRMGAGGPTLRGLLADAAERADVRVIAWAGARCPSSTRIAAKCARCATNSCAAHESPCSSTRASGRCTATTRSS